MPEGIPVNKETLFHFILKNIINATCPEHREQVNRMLSKFPAIFDGENFELYYMKLHNKKGA